VRWAGYGPAETGAPSGHFGELTEFNGRILSSRVRLRTNIVGPDFVRALGATIIIGHSFDVSHDASPIPVVINETLARRLAPAMIQGTVPVGVVASTVYVGSERSTFRIIGVIRDLVYGTPTEPATPQMFRLSSKVPGFFIMIRTAGPVEDTMPRVRATLERIWGDLPEWRFSLLRDAWHAGLTPFRGKALLVSLVGGFCVPLAAIGLIGALL
jgi:hypothetical protein